MAPAEENDALSKRLKERRNRIKEILDTESIFLQDMMVVEDIYKATSTSIDSVSNEDRKVLFGNSADIVNFSRTFLDALKPAAAPIYTLPKSNRWNFKRGSFSTSNSTNTEQSTSLEPPKNDQDRMTTIGAIFGRNMASLEKVFGDYLKNLDFANQRLVALQDKPKVKVWLEECHNYASDITQAWSLDSLLVKPLQRITRYPLLLDSLIATTPADHPDHADLVSAKKELLAASVRINENKKRAELLDQFANRKRKESDGRIPTGLSKAFGRRTDKLKVSVGLTEHVEDTEYDAIAQKFGGHFFQLQIVMRDVEKYMDDVQTFVDQCNSQVAALIEFLDVDQTGQMRPSRDMRVLADDYTEIESKWRKYGQTMLELTTIALPEHVAAIRKSVIDPIMTLWKLHDQPQKLMQKRKKRLPEYAKYKQMKDRGEKMDKKTQENGTVFEELNQGLKDDLPRLYALTKKLIERCLLSLINIQITWQSTFERKLQPMLETPPERTDVFSDDMQTYSQRFVSDYDIIHSRIQALSSCNKTLMAEITNFLSPAQTFVTDDASSFKKPSTYSSGKRTQSLSSDVSTPDISQRHSGNFTGWHRGPSTPRSAQATTPAISNFPQRPSTGAGRSVTDSTVNFPRLSLEMEQRNNSGSGPGFLTPSYSSRTSGVFSSALPMSDSPTVMRSQSPEPQEEHHVLFLAASLFEFNIAHDRQEAGFPYLVYVPGEIFDVVALKGELWLARNQDDMNRTIGWIWEKHFARILPDEG
ncbi:Dbl homology domain-containing protein [Mytilinidion resinicola]|uniref:Dbl homology domain-containing protein n=1 Tax=Mytilinidion resinicola TaxID=574789 RepID=A0A6A6YMJ6_9PEZI|nr:Dbl homology domain-containing protein [Mytilinidion resinicola]KAF2810102.1 Dbl homology domain-containing protein [Mytilinidion resinicola]